MWAIGEIFRNKISIKEISLFFVPGTCRVKRLVAENFGQKCVQRALSVAASQIYRT